MSFFQHSAWLKPFWRENFLKCLVEVNTKPSSLLGLKLFLETSCRILISSGQLHGKDIPLKPSAQISGIRQSFGYSIPQPMTVTVLFLILTLCSQVAITFQRFRCLTNNYNKIWYLKDRFCFYTFGSQTGLKMLNQIVIISIKVEFNKFPWSSQWKAQQSIYKPDRNRAYLVLLHLVTWL